MSRPPDGAKAYVTDPRFCKFCKMTFRLCARAEQRATAKLISPITRHSKCGHIICFHTTQGTDILDDLTPSPF